jgi:hypothetical protein
VTDSRHRSQLASIEKTTFALAAVVMGFAWLALSHRTAVSASIGAGIMALNAYSLRKIGHRVNPSDRPRAGLLLFNVKMAVLLGLVFLCVRYLPIDPIAFLVGVSVFPMAIVIVAVRHALTPTMGSAPSNESQEAPEDIHG